MKTAHQHILSEYLTAAVVESSEDAIFTKTLEGHILTWNNAAEQLFGYTASEAIGQSVDMLIPIDQQNKERQTIERLGRGERIKNYETVRIAKDGRLVDISLSISALYDSNGKIIGALKIARDITEQKRLREYSANQIKGLMQLNELVAKLANAHDAQSMLEAILSTITSLHQTDFGLLFLYHPETDALHIGASLGFCEEFKTHLKRMKPGMGSCGTAYAEKRRVIVEDTENDPLFISMREIARKYNLRSAHSTPVVNRAGVCIGVLCVCFHEPRRPTELETHLSDLYVRQAADFMERIKNEEALKEADRRKDEFLAMLAHELRNPLAPITHGIHVLDSPHASEEIKDEARKMMKRQVHQMKRLIDDLMDISRVNQGKIELQKQQLCLNDIIQAALETANPLITEKRHEIIISQPYDPIWLEGDMVRLSQIFANLLNNAAKYTDEGGCIIITIHKEGLEVIISIKDNGIGIPKKMLSSIFALFVQVDNTLERAQDGLGIGLTLVKELVALHGGRVSVYSKGKGTGSEFTVRLPVVLNEIQQPSASAAIPTSTKKKYQVLVIDDNEAWTKTLGWTLELLGHEVQLAHDAKTGIEIARASQPDVILLDIGLPYINGYDLCKQMRQETETKNTVIIAQTGWGQQEHRNLSRQAGFDHHLVKPIEMHTLQKLLESLNK